MIVQDQLTSTNIDEQFSHIYHNENFYVILGCLVCIIDEDLNIKGTGAFLGDYKFLTARECTVNVGISAWLGIANDPKYCINFEIERTDNHPSLAEVNLEVSNSICVYNSQHP